MRRVGAHPWSSWSFARGPRLGAALLALCCIGTAAALLRPLPPELLAPVTATEIVDRNGALLTRRPAPERAPGRPLSLEELGEDLVAATLAAEDHRFRLHPGVDPVGVVRAAAANARAGRVVQGGSTVTQQLARNLVPRSPGFVGKAMEAWLALRLEVHLDKSSILAEYLSRVYYGNAALGADAAAHVYFDRPPAALSLAQAATLAAIPRRPRDLDPFRYPLRVHEARNRILVRMEALRLASPGRVAEAMAEPLTLVPADVPGEAPHFTRRVWSVAPRIHTTLDLELQRSTEAAVAEVLSALTPRQASHAAVIVVHNRTRDVLAYVGSGGWRKPEGQVDGVMAERSSGSTLKPFLYAAALEEGRTLADLLDDAPGTWPTVHGNWHPQNYDRASGGAVTMREALARSLNLPAVRLAEQVGVAELHRTLGALGLTTLTRRPDHYGLSLALGGADVRLDELAAAYATLASGGRWRPLRFRMDDARPPPRRVLRETTAFQIFDALDDDAARAPAFGVGSPLEAPFPMAAKTGTSTGWRDNWAVGVSPEITVAAWVGNFDGQPMVDISGVTGAGPILSRVMETAMAGRAWEAGEAPKGLERLEVCPVSGELRGPGCVTSRLEWLPAGANRSVCRTHAPSAAERGRVGGGATSGARPRILTPSDGAVYWLDPDRSASDQELPLITEARGGVARWEVDGELLIEAPAAARARWRPTPGTHTLRVIVDGESSSSVQVHVGTSLDREPPAP